MKKKLVQRTLDRLLSPLEVEPVQAMVNFYSYEDHENKVEDKNVKPFYANHLMDPEFSDKFLCFRVFLIHSQVNVKQVREDDDDLQVLAEKVLVENPKTKRSRRTSATSTYVWPSTTRC